MSLPPHVTAPPGGFVDATAVRMLLTATHNAADGQAIAVRPPPADTGTDAHASGPPVGVVEVTTLNVPDTTHNTSDAHDTALLTYGAVTWTLDHAARGSVGAVVVRTLPSTFTATQSDTVGHEMSASSKPVTAWTVHDAEPAAGLVETATDDPPTATQRDVEGHDTASSDPATGPADQMPDVGCADVAIRFEDTATHSDGDGQAMSSKREPGSAGLDCQPLAPPPGATVVSALPLSSTAAQNEPAHETPFRLRLGTTAGETCQSLAGPVGFGEIATRPPLETATQ
jgi:hypothetical protein